MRGHYTKESFFRSDFSSFDNQKKHRRAEWSAGISIIFLMGSVLSLVLVEHESPIFYGVLGLFILSIISFMLSEYRTSAYVKKFCYTCGRDFTFHEKVIERVHATEGHTVAAYHESCAEGVVVFPKKK
ncbi:MAG: hypothetical protein Q8O83_03215 [bacterium]|nr:hypothetical protein [bacterium]